MPISPTNGRRQKKAAGFTLIEILVVLTIVALAAAVVAPTLGSAVGWGQLQRETGAVVSGLRAARAQAMTSGASVDFVVEGRRWQIGETVTKVSSGVILTLDVPPAGADTTRPFIRFFPDGRSTGGRVHLVRDDRTETVQVNWIAGHARQTR
jgi:general secretion pathway protein H